jgi:hypothetical protein
LTSPRNSVDPHPESELQNSDKKHHELVLAEGFNIFSRGSDSAPVVAHKPIEYDDNDHSDIDYRMMSEFGPCRHMGESQQL